MEERRSFPARFDAQGKRCLFRRVIDDVAMSIEGASLFEPVVSEDRFHPSFRLMLEGPSHAPARVVMDGGVP
jgi:hypothetical protein